MTKTPRTGLYLSSLRLCASVLDFRDEQNPRGADAENDGMPSCFVGDSRGQGASPGNNFTRSSEPPSWTA